MNVGATVGEEGVAVGVNIGDAVAVVVSTAVLLQATNSTRETSIPTYVWSLKLTFSPILISHILRYRKVSYGYVHLPINSDVKHSNRN